MLESKIVLISCPEFQNSCPCSFLFIPVNLRQRTPSKTEVYDKVDLVRKANLFLSNPVPPQRPHKLKAAFSEFPYRYISY